MRKHRKLQKHCVCKIYHRIGCVQLNIDITKVLLGRNHFLLNMYRHLKIYSDDEKMYPEILTDLKFLFPRI
jgi:hypothetical protein